MKKMRFKKASENFASLESKIFALKKKSNYGTEIRDLSERGEDPLSI